MVDRVEDIGYLLLFVYSFGGGLIGLATAAVLASVGKLNLVLAIALAGGANFIGSSLLFYFARNSKNDASTYLKKHRRKLALAHILMKRWGSSVIFIQKFVYGVKTLIPLAAGITKYDAFKFISLNLAASFVWALVIGLGSYMLGDMILKALKSFENYPFLAPVALVCIVGGIYFYMAKTTKKENRV